MFDPPSYAVSMQCTLRLVDQIKKNDCLHFKESKSGVANRRWYRRT